MTRQFKLPDLGEGVHEGQVIKLLVAEGDQILEDQPLMEVETDKAAVEIPSPYTGTLQSVHVKEQQIVNVGDVMFTFDGGDSEPESPVEQRAGATRQAAVAANTRRASSGTIPVNGGIKPASPAVRRKAREIGVDLHAVAGTGPNGRVTMRDVMDTASGGGVSAGSVAQASQSALQTKRATSPVRSAPRPVSVAVLPDGADGSGAHGATRRVPISMARKTIGQNMVQSISTIPHVTDNDDADITELDALRRGYVYEDDSNRKLRVLPFAIRAVARALQRFPIFNSVFDDETNEIVYRRYFSIAIGVHTQRGLVAPVIRSVDQMGVLDIADALDGLAEQARGSGFSVSDTRGGTFTISNAGAMGGSRYSSPIISPGQSAVLALGRGRTQPWVVGDSIVPRLIQPLSLSFDHRHIDGADEIAFMQFIIADLENPARVML